MTVHFIGAGPGAPDLITLRGRDLLGRCPVCLYAGSLVHRDILAHCPAGAKIVDTAPMSLDEIVGEIIADSKQGMRLSSKSAEGEWTDVCIDGGEITVCP